MDFDIRSFKWRDNVGLARLGELGLDQLPFQFFVTNAKTSTRKKFLPVLETAEFYDGMGGEYADSTGEFKIVLWMDE